MSCTIYESRDITQYSMEVDRIVMMKQVLTATAVTLFTVGAAFAQGTMAPKTDAMAGHDHDAMAKAGDVANVKNEMTATDLKAKLDKGDKIVVIDARGNVGNEMIKGAIHVPVAQIGEWAKGKDKATWVVTYCTCPHDEAAAAEVKQLRDLGFTNAFVLAGGMNAAKTAGMSTGAPEAQ